MFIDANLRFCTDQDFGGAMTTIDGVDQVATDDIDLGSVGDFDIGSGHPLFLHIRATTAPAPYGDPSSDDAWINSVSFRLYHRNNPTGWSGTTETLMIEGMSSAYPITKDEEVILRLLPVPGYATGRYVRLEFRVNGTVKTGSGTDIVQFRASAWISGEGPLTNIANTEQVSGG